MFNLLKLIKSFRTKPVTKKEPEFPVVEMDDSFYVQKQMCCLGGCDFDFVGPFDTEQEAKSIATEMENEGEKFNKKGACPECFYKYVRNLVR